MIATAPKAAATVTPLAEARFIDLVTFRRTGEPVGTPVLFVRDGERLLVRTATGTGKLKRLAHTSNVELTPCDQHGQHLGATLTGEARILGPEAVGPTLARLHRRYRIVGPLFSMVRRLRRQPDVIVEITLDHSQIRTDATTRAPMAASASAAGRRRPDAPVLVATVAMVVGLVLAACGGGAPGPADVDVVGASDDSVAVVGVGETATDAASTDDGTDSAESEAADDSLAIALCAAVSAADAASALGQEIGDAVALDKGSQGSTCRYTALDGAARVSVWGHRASDRAAWDATMEKTGMTVGSTVDDIGEAAWLETGNAQRVKTRLAILDAGFDVWIEIVGAAEPSSAAGAADRFARAVLAGTH